MIASPEKDSSLKVERSNSVNQGISPDSKVEEKLARVKKMYDQGLITKEEYDKERAEALESL